MKGNNLIFIVSQPRSGSTLLQAIISNNLEVATVSEPWLLLPFLSYKRPDLTNAVYSSKLAFVGINEFKSKIDSEKFEDDLASFLLKQYNQIKKNNELYVLDKTPRYYEILDEIVELFPNAKIIILKRNPFAVLASIINTWKSNNISALFYYKRDLLNAPILINNFAKKHIKNPNVYIIKYEDLIQTPSFHIKSMYNWLNIKFDNSVLYYTNNEKYKGEMGDPTGIKSNTSPNSINIDKWKETYHNDKWKSIFFGYSHYLTEDFLIEYGNYNFVPPKKTPIFQQYLKYSFFNFNIYELPYTQLLKIRLLKLFRLSKI